jgi:hypothetical protein
MKANPLDDKFYPDEPARTRQGLPTKEEVAKATPPRETGGPRGQSRPDIAVAGEP